MVYIGARDSKIYAIDYSSRKIIWQYKTDGWVDSSPAIADGVLYIGSNDGYIYAFANASLASAAGQEPTRTRDQAEEHYSGRIGVVTRDGVRVYARAGQGTSHDNMSSIIARVNEGELLPIMRYCSVSSAKSEKNGEWYQVRLPNGKNGWMSWLDFVPVKW